MPVVRFAVIDAVAALVSLPSGTACSESVAWWSSATKLALELCARRRVVPRLRDGEARWAALLTHSGDTARFDMLLRSMPPAAHAATASRSPLRVEGAASTLRSYLDAVADQIYRSGTWPGGSRGWPRRLAESLSNSAPAFQPDDARDHAISARLEARGRAIDAPRLRLGLRLHLPKGSQPKFPLHLTVHGRKDTIHRPIADAWGVPELAVGDEVFPSPTIGVSHALARAVRAFPPLEAALTGKVPTDLTLGPDEAWQLLSAASEGLEAAGVHVHIPNALAERGTQRLRARMRLELEGDLNLSTLLNFRWEVSLGDRVLDGAEFAELRRRNQPIVHHRGEWIVLDPREIAKLPNGIDGTGSLRGAAALRAVLLGEHEGVPVVADRRLELLLEALRHPPEVEPPPSIQAKLRPYQIRGYSWLHTLGAIGLGACLADDMGLGKTLQTIVHLARRAGPGKRSLVVCPTSLIGNWNRELERFAPSLRVHTHHAQRSKLPNNVDIVLTTYGVLVHDPDPLLAANWDVVVLDEAQAIKNPDSQRARNARKLKGAHRVALSGTPVENRLEELWSLMEFLVPGMLGPRATFLREVALPIERFGDQDAADRLKRGVAPFMLRREKRDPGIADELPDKIERVEGCLLTAEQKKLYEQVCEEQLENLEGLQGLERRGRMLAMLTALKQVCNHPAQYLREPGPLAGRSGKLERLLALVDRFEGEPALVFTQYTAMGELLASALGQHLGQKIPFFHGASPPKVRDAMVADFQRPNGPPILLISLKAGGTGLNLTRARHVVHYDRWWNPAVEDQATDRAHRIGQRHQVLVHKLVAEDTLEERIHRLLESKRHLASSVLAGGEGWLAELDDDALRRLVMLGNAP